jgi:hypothetical protein
VSQRLEVDLRLAFFAVFLLAFLADFTAFSPPTNPLTLFSKSLNARESAAWAWANVPFVFLAI